MVNAGKCEVVGQEHQPFAGLGVFESNAPQWRVEVLARVEASEHDGLIADQSGGAIDRMRITTLGLEIGLGAGDEEAFRLVQLMKPLEVDVAAIHDVESTGLGQQQVQNVDVVQFAVADVDERRDIAAQVQQRVQLDGRLGRAKRRPRKYRQAQVDGAGIQSIDRVFQIDAKRFCGVQTAGDGDQRLGEVGVDAPVAHRVGIGQRVARNRLRMPM